MKIVTICEGGTVRSVALARSFKQHGHDAIALSKMWNSQDTFNMLSEWADKIVYVKQSMLKLIPEEHRYKSLLVKGFETDPWCNPLHPKLLKLVEKTVQEIL